MATIDWIVLFLTLAFIVIYGIYRSGKSGNIEGYLMGNKEFGWWTVGLSVMATQASAITFLSTPGQAYTDGMRFIQFYFGLPLAIIVIAIFIIPVFQRLNVYTAYEYLESRFDLKTRLFTAFLFLIQRGLAAGITIYAPAIILSKVLGWPLNTTNLLIGVLVVLYTVSGGTRAVSITQKQQMAVIFGGMVVAFFILLSGLPEGINFPKALELAGASGKLNLVDLDFDLSNRYNIWSGLLGGFFLALSYFGTDQSQVQRYITAKNTTQSRLGLLFNGIAKIPMQFSILLTGALVFVFYLFQPSPVFFNTASYQDAKSGIYKSEFNQLEAEHSANNKTKSEAALTYADALDKKDQDLIQESKKELNEAIQKENRIREKTRDLIRKSGDEYETEDTDYIFITFVLNHLPVGIVGLLFAVIFSAAMSSTSSELNALASTTTVDFYKRVYKREASDKHYLLASRLITLFWGMVAITFAVTASLIDNLIEAVNILGSLFYGSILGIFICALFIKHLKSTPVFIGGIIAELTIIFLYITTDIGFLWYNLIGCGLVVILALILNIFTGTDKRMDSHA